jgi:hypothetical protein
VVLTADQGPGDQVERGASGVDDRCYRRTVASGRLMASLLATKNPTAVHRSRAGQDTAPIWEARP